MEDKLTSSRQTRSLWRRAFSRHSPFQVCAYPATPFIIDSNMAMRLAASDASMALSLCTAGLVARSTDAQSSFPPPLPALPGVAYAPVAAVPGVVFAPLAKYVPGVVFAPLAKYVPGVAASRRNAANPSVVSVGGDGNADGNASPPLPGDVQETCFAFAPETRFAFVPELCFAFAPVASCTLA